ncbi:MAG TPA: MBL fold metallo-hydrolase [Clostridia bacterium]|nr:MBL fold metallo-hydrolase [Clostridia bacterium]
MSDAITITTLVENTVNIGGLRGEHGLAFLIRCRGQKLLFDTGQSDLLLYNAERMGLALGDVQGVVLSHGHYDHTGGLDAVCKVAPRAQIFLHPTAIEPKFTKNADGTSRAIGMKADSAAVIRQAEHPGYPSPSAHAVVWTENPQEVMDGIWVTGEIPRRTCFEDTGGHFYQDAECTRPDPLLDDQAVFFETPQGVVVVLGCGHAGVVNTLEYVTELTKGKPIRAVLGGMHLLAAGADRMDRTLEAFRRWDIKKLSPAHCTGISAVARLWAAFPERCSACPVGTNIAFEKA